MEKSSPYKWKNAITTTLLPLPLKHKPWPFSITGNPISSIFPQYPHLYSHLRMPVTPCRYRRRDSNFTAGDDEGDEGCEDFLPKRRRRRRRRRWWSDKWTLEMEQESGILEEFIDSLWIFKVFGFYGWWLPAIIISMLLATGAKAFLMALAATIGQSALSLAFKKLWAQIPGNPKGKFKAKRKARGRGKRTVKLEEEEEEETQKTQNGTMGYHSWMGADLSANKDSDDSSTFKGWDELDRGNKFDAETMRRSARIHQSRRKSVKKGTFIRRDRQREMPLLLRLLVAVFPFLGSWTKML